MREFFRILDWVVLIALAIIGFLALCVWFFPDLEAKEISSPTILTASWYSVDSLKKEGTYKYSKGVMANGNLFMDDALTCATRQFPLGSILRITSLSNRKTVEVKVTDRIGKRFAQTRIDLSKLAFSKLDKLEKGIIRVKVERIK